MPRVLDLCATGRVTMAARLPNVWMAMLASIDAEPPVTGDLDRLIVGGAAVPRSMFEGFDRHGLTVVQAWGMTETAPLGSVCRLPVDLDESDADEQYGYRGRQGVASPLFETRARDEDGQFIAWDDAATGELEVRGPWVAASYHGGRGATASPPTAGSRPVTWFASMRTAASGSATAQRIW
jgi:fatty-acyl-CoA synthase